MPALLHKENTVFALPDMYMRRGVHQEGARGAVTLLHDPLVENHIHKCQLGSQNFF